LGHQPTQGRGWKLIWLPATGAKKEPSERAIVGPKLDAVAIIGLGPMKARYAQKALLSGKHALVDFPLSHEFKEILRLQRIAEERKLCLHSPNLLRTESSIQELKRMTHRPSGRILSLTLTCSVNTRFKRTDFAAKFVQLLDLSEWLTNSKCIQAHGKISTIHPSITASVVTLCLESGVIGLVNLYSTPSNSPGRLWIDAVFEDSLLHVDPFAQAVRLSRFRDNASESVNWAPSSLSIALEDFVACIRSKELYSIPDETERIFDLARSTMGV